MTDVNEKNANNQTVFIVDDDSAIRHAMGLLLESVGHQCEVYGSADEFLAAVDTASPGCLVLDIRMPRMSGLELQEKLAAGKSAMPIIFITGHGDVPMAVEAMQKGAIDFIQKPFRDQELLDRISDAMQTDSERRSSRRSVNDIVDKISRLTKREQEVFDLVATGKPNKIVAYELGVSQRTVEIHRARVMEKIEAASLADLVRIHLTISGLDSNAT
ncbi:MAG: response regulator transcription factor [Woeseia sp.]|jgi:two-component system, LuxR family, response regulator FixJ|nr:response regulator transcription factor [Woeseia sp.]